MQARLPHALEGRDITVVGQVRGLPRHRPDMESFRLHIEHAQLDGRTLSLHGLVRLAWYRAPQAVTACSSWQLRVRLKRPRGLADPGVFDSERYALQHRQVAVGYVRPQGPHRRGLASRGAAGGTGQFAGGPGGGRQTWPAYATAAARPGHRRFALAGHFRLPYRYCDTGRCAGDACVVVVVAAAGVTLATAQRRSPGWPGWPGLCRRVRRAGRLGAEVAPGI